MMGSTFSHNLAKTMRSCGLSSQFNSTSYIKSPMLYVEADV